MNKNSTIRYLAAMFLILVFVLGNSPKQWLHEVFAHHKDLNTGFLLINDQEVVSKEGIHCSCDHFVIESAFTTPVNPITNITGVDYPALPSLFINMIINPPQFFSELRGPPVVG